MSDVQSRLEAHLEAEAPNECVGLLLWDGTVIQLRNQAQSPHRFFVNPQQLIDREQEFTSPILAMYHSHPHRPAVPSGEDERMMHYLETVWPQVYHIILSPQGHAAYHVVDGQVKERNLPW